jgi:hypothetical protein
MLGNYRTKLSNSVVKSPVVKSHIVHAFHANFGPA